MGSYIGVSAMAVAKHIPPGGRLITTELHKQTAEMARQMVRFAGLDEVYFASLCSQTKFENDE